MISAALVLLSAAAFAQTPPPSALAPDDVTDWSVEAPAKPGQATSAEGSFSNAETIRFGEQMRHNVWEQVCRAISLPINQGYSKDGLGFSGQFDRSIQVLPDQRLALVEQAGLSLDLGRTLATVTEGASVLGISIYAHLDGTSMVVRPLPTKNSCKELGKVLQFWTHKTVLPLKAERIQAMEVGELWKLPADLSIGHVESITAPIANYGSASVSFGTGQNGASMITLYRLAPDKLRVRLRIDHARVVNKGGQVVASMPAVDLIQAGGMILVQALEKALDRAVARMLSDFISASVGITSPTTNGQQLLMEFVLDPRDDAQMAKLAGVLRGDIKTLVTMAEKTVTLQATPEKAEADLRRLKEQHERDLGQVSSYPALDIYHNSSRNIWFALPFFVKHTASKITADDQIIQLSAEGGQVHIFRAEKTSETGLFNVPIKGTLVKHNLLRSAQSFTFESKDGVVTPPQAVYIQQEGFLRKDASDYRESLAEINRVMSLVGARGGAPNPRLTVPVDPLVPPLPPPTRDAQGELHQPTRGYGTGSIQWTLVMTKEAVNDILTASNDLIVRCFVNTLDAADQSLMGWVMSQPAWLNADGSVNFDWRAARAHFGYSGNPKFSSNQNGDWDYNHTEELTKVVTKIIMDVDNARRAPTQEAKADAMTTLLAGRGESGLEYQDILKVLVQLIDPLHVTSDLAVNISKGVKGDPDTHAHLVLKNFRPENLELKQAGDAKTRFAKPSNLVD